MIPAIRPTLSCWHTLYDIPGMLYAHLVIASAEPIGVTLYDGTKKRMRDARRRAVKARCIMTIAEKTALHEQRLEKLQGQIREILREHRRPLRLPEIEFFLQKARYDRGESIEATDTFEVRDAIARLRRAGVVEETVGRDVQLVRE